MDVRTAARLGTLVSRPVWVVSKDRRAITHPMSVHAEQGRSLAAGKSQPESLNLDPNDTGCLFVLG
jgi:hypothetical protein